LPYLGMDLLQQFEIIRPYRDHEVNAAVRRLVAHPGFEGVLKYLYGDQDPGELTKRFLAVETVDQFQLFFSRYTVKTIVDKTSAGLTDQGAEHLDQEKPYLFIANHRDIVLDAAIMQYLLHIHGHRTSQITFGENLMSGQLLLDLGKLNKMFTFYRGGSKVRQYRNALINSAYINHVIKEEGESIWIAQRNGRTKNGDDRTQSGLIKMLAVGGGEICESLCSLNMVPVTISYEIEPCDIQKVRELYISRRRKYEKAPGEDLNSILAGITGDKGRIHYSFGTPLNRFIEALAGEKLHDNDVIERIAAEIDRQIHADYRVWPGNYVAADLLEGSDAFRGHYSTEEQENFERTMNAKISSLEGFDREETRNLYLQLYANPVFNKRTSASS
jgi:hypothetical protein